jgi:hypothetical protein
MLNLELGHRRWGEGLSFDENIVYLVCPEAAEFSPLKFRGMAARGETNLSLLFCCSNQ